MDEPEVINGWKVLGRAVKPSDPKRAYHRVECRCGAERIVELSKIRSGRWQTCGCGYPTHGMSRAAKDLRQTWRGMIARCMDPADESYPNYGGRGIAVCDAWVESFEQFVADVGPRPGPGYSIDRIDNDGHYEPGNVRWATAVQQGRNKRNNHVIESGDHAHTIAEWAELIGCDPMVIHSRLRDGWAPQEAVLTFPRAYRRRKAAVAS
jgi:hypothetical protein